MLRITSIKGFSLLLKRLFTRAGLIKSCDNCLTLRARKRGKMPPQQNGPARYGALFSKVVGGLAQHQVGEENTITLAAPGNMWRILCARAAL